MDRRDGYEASHPVAPHPAADGPWRTYRLACRKFQEAEREMTAAYAAWCKAEEDAAEADRAIAASTERSTFP
jgi:hypothetical protein